MDSSNTFTISSEWESIPRMETNAAGDEATSKEITRLARGPLRTGKMTWGTFLNILQLNRITIRRVMFTGQGDPVGAGTYFEVWRHKISRSSEMLSFLTQDNNSLPIGSLVALKRIIPRVNEDSKQVHLSDERQLEAIALEVQVLSTAQLRCHRNIIELYAVVWESRGDLGTAAWPTLVLEYCPYTLSEYQRQHSGPLPIEEKVRLFREIELGIAALHSEGFVHGDLKSENVLIKISEAGIPIPKLADFGCSIVKKVISEDDVIWIGGTPRWRAPEVLIV